MCRRLAPEPLCPTAAHGTVDDHDGVAGPLGVTGFAHRLDPAVRGVIASSAASCCPAELADGRGLFLGGPDKVADLGIRWPQGGSDADAERAELFLEVLDPVVGAPYKESGIQHQGMSARADDVQPVGQLPCTAAFRLMVLHSFPFSPARHGTDWQQRGRHLVASPVIAPVGAHGQRAQ